MSPSSQEDSIKEGKEHEEISFSFKAVEIAEIMLGVTLLSVETVTLIFAMVGDYWSWAVSLSGCGI